MTTGPLNKFVEASLRRADECLKGAKILLKEGELHGAVSRAYYGEPGIMGKEFADILRNLFNARQLSDYEVYAELDRDEVQTLLAQANEFLSAAKEILEGNQSRARDLNL